MVNLYCVYIDNEIKFYKELVVFLILEVYKVLRDFFKDTY